MSVITDLLTRERHNLLTIFLSVCDDLVRLLVGLVAVHGDLQAVHVGVLVLDHFAEEHPGGARLVGVFVVHRIFLAVIFAVLRQHLGKHNMPLIPGDGM